ncbi:unnamed protein product [Brachionus calyciflorus]|uniref:Uncharacterized protein n=1 Tax=Brachionus calyciflorus TaxID=104777 RepID=A0A813YZI9_9BILA|nr:unnamed protein product [Brachionus calyciflorus]
MNKEIQQREKLAKHKAKSNSDEFIVSHNRIKKQSKLLHDEECVPLQSRSTQTDASIFDSISKLENRETQTEWSQYADVLIHSK